MDHTVRDLPAGAWPPGLTRVPYWVYRDPEVARDEQARVFEGPGWHYLCLEID
ncbi:MAG: anthranilate 1,2-dioxygenase large subunit, partial [Acetobacteraceae bacterium]|nr:anthranilate 1,2-dioxygenase large subunit [Acetobacteraceae bacterium]